MPLVHQPVSQSTRQKDQLLAAGQLTVSTQHITQAND